MIRLESQNKTKMVSEEFRSQSSQSFTLNIFPKQDSLKEITPEVKQHQNQVEKDLEKKKNKEIELDRKSLLLNESVWDYYIPPSPTTTTKKRLKIDLQIEKPIAAVIEENEISTKIPVRHSICDVCSRLIQQSFQLLCKHQICFVCAAKSILKIYRPLAIESRNFIHKFGAFRFLKPNIIKRHIMPKQKFDLKYIKIETNNDPYLLRVDYPIFNKESIPSIGETKESAFGDHLDYKEFYGERSIVSKNRPLLSIPHFSIDSIAMEKQFAWPPDWYHSYRMKDEYAVNQDHDIWAKRQRDGRKIGANHHTQTPTLALTCPKCKKSTFLQPHMSQILTSVLFNDESLSPDYDLFKIAPLDLADHMGLPRHDGTVSNSLQLGHAPQHITTNATAFGKCASRKETSEQPSHQALSVPTPIAPLPKAFRSPMFTRMTSIQKDSDQKKRTMAILQSQITLPPVPNRYPLSHVSDCCNRCGIKTNPPPLIGLARQLELPQNSRDLSKEEMKQSLLVEVPRDMKSAMEQSLFYCSQCVEYLCWECARIVHNTKSTAIHQLVLLDEYCTALPMSQQSILMKGRPRDQELTRQIEIASSDVTDVFSIDEQEQFQRPAISQMPKSVFSVPIIRRYRTTEHGSQGIPKQSFFNETLGPGREADSTERFSFLGKSKTNRTIDIPIQKMTESQEVIKGFEPWVLESEYLNQEEKLGISNHSISDLASTSNYDQNHNSLIFKKSFKTNDDIKLKDRPLLQFMTTSIHGTRLPELSHPQMQRDSSIVNNTLSQPMFRNDGQMKSSIRDSNEKQNGYCSKHVNNKLDNSVLRELQRSKQVKNEIRLIENPKWKRLVGQHSESGGNTIREINNCGISALNNPNEFPFNEPSIMAYQCSQHPEEPVHCFCLECEVACFCSCCVLDGHHRGHEVVVVKEAWEALKVRRLKTEIQTKMELLVQDSLKLELAIHEMRKEKMDVTNSAKDDIEKSLSSLVEILQASEKSLEDNMNEIVNLTTKELDEHIKQVEDVLAMLIELNDRLHINSITHINPKLCQFYHDFIHPTDSKFKTVLDDLNFPRQLHPIANSIWNRQQFFVETSFTRLAAMDQASHLIRDIPTFSRDHENGISVDDTAATGLFKTSKEL